MVTTKRANRTPGWLPVVLALGPAIALALFFGWPLAALLGRALGAEVIGDTLGRAATWRVVWFTLWQAVASTALTIAIGLAPAWIIARYRFAGRSALIGLLTAMFVLPTVVMGAAMMALLPHSLQRTVWAVLAAHVMFNLAVVVRVVGAMWERLPDGLEHAAATLGASRWRVFTSITLPLLRPAIVAAATIVFLFTFTSYGVVRVLGAPGTRTVEVEIWRWATQLGDVGGAAVLAVIQLAVLGVAVTWSSVSQRRHTRALALVHRQRRRRPRGPNERLVVGAVAWSTAILAAAPLAALVVRSLHVGGRWSTRAWTTLGTHEIRPGVTLGIDPAGAIGRSLTTAIWATVIAVVIGALASLAIATATRYGRVLDIALMLPLATSAVTVGFGILITFDDDPFDWRAEWWIVPIAQALIAVPFVVRTCVGVLRSLHPDLSQAAATLGATPLTAWRTTVLPYLWKPLGAATGMAAAISLGEFGATSLLSRSGGETLPIAIQQLLGRTGSILQAQGYVLATMLAFGTVVIVIASERLNTGAGADPT